MTPETVEQVIRFIVSTYADKKVKITWFGGEPLLGEGIIDRICEGLREAGVEYKSTIISNGSLISPEIISKMVREWKTYKRMVEHREENSGDDSAC
jgi:sulfatase maturation enzyme AslB (radical SAM superfamily)